MQQVLIHQILLKKMTWLIQSDVDKLNFDKFEKLPSGLRSLKSKVDTLDIGKLETTSVDLSKLGDRVKNDNVKKTDDELVEKVNNIKTTDTTNLVKITVYNTKLIKLKKVYRS